MTPREPSGGTAIAAASLAAAGAATALTETVGVIVWPFVVSGLHGVPVPVEWSVALQGVAGSLELILLGVGSTLLFLRRPMGRRMAKAGCVVHLVQGVIVIGKGHKFPGSHCNRGIGVACDSPIFAQLLHTDSGILAGQ